MYSIYALLETQDFLFTTFFWLFFQANCIFATRKMHLLIMKLMFYCSREHKSNCDFMVNYDELSFFRRVIGACF